MRKFTAFVCVIALTWGCSTQRRAQSMREVQSAPSIPSKTQTSADVLMPEGSKPQTTQQSAVVVGADGVTRPAMGLESDYMNVPMQFNPVETQHVKLVTISPRMGEMLVLPLNVMRERFCYPYQGDMISAYGPRSGRVHSGADIRAPQGDTIRAALPGVVRMSKPYYNYGNIVVIRHPCGLETLYGHNVRNLVEVGQPVMQGQAIALAGHTGNATTDHVHFEVLAAGQHFDPAMMLDYGSRTLKNDTLYIFNKGNGLLVLNSVTAKAYFNDKPDAQPRTLTADCDMPVKLPAAPTARRAAAAAPIPPGATTHTVAKGDYLTKIAHDYHVSVEQLCSWNGIQRDDVLQIGQRLVVAAGSDKPVPQSPAQAAPAKPQPQPAAPVAAAAEPAPAVSRPQPGPAETPATHTLQSGETLNKVVRRYGITLAELCRLNGITDPDDVDAGQVLRLREDAPAAPATVSKPAPAPATDGMHTVRKGETLSRIATNYSVTVARLCEINGIEKDAILREGQQLRVK